MIACGERAPVPSGVATRIVSLYPAATETLFALGAGEQVVGRSRFCDFPPEARDLPAVGDAVSTSAERIFGLDPDLVLVGSAPQRESLGGLAGRVRVESVTADSIAEVRTMVRRLAEWSGRAPAGEELLEEIDASLAAARGDPVAPVKVLFVAQREPLIVAGGATWVGELLGVLGLENVAGDLDAAWPTLSLETVVVRDPDLILDASVAPGEPSGEAQRFWSRFQTLRAVRNGRVIRVEESAVLRPGPRIPEALDRLRNLSERGR